MSENWKEKVKRRSGEIIVAAVVLVLLICLLSMTAPFWNQSAETDEPNSITEIEPSQMDIKDVEPSTEPICTDNVCTLPEEPSTAPLPSNDPEPSTIAKSVTNPKPSDEDKKPSDEQKPDNEPEPSEPVVQHSHAYAVESVIAPTCTKEGYTVYICSCGDTYNSDYKDALGHLWGQWSVTKQPSESENGTEKRVCERCGIEESRSIEKLIHSHSHAVESVVEPTCLDKGYSVYACKCGNTYKADYKDALGHLWSDWETVKKPTTSQKGLEQRTCKRCGEKEERDIDKLPSGGGGGGHSHSYSVDKIVEPTCTEKGYSVYICRCGRTYNSDYTDALNHDWNLWETIKNPSETEEGIEKRTCSRGDAEEERSIEKLTHSHSHAVESIVEPTCTEQGYTIYRCPCGDNYTADFTDALNHDWNDWETVKPASETEEGLERRTCKRGDAEEERSIDKLPSEGNVLIGQWYNDRNHFVTFNEDGTGVLMDGYTSDEASVVITFNYELMDIEGEEDKEIVFSNLNIIKSEDATVDEMGALEQGGRVIVFRNYIHISGFMFRTKL